MGGLLFGGPIWAQDAAVLPRADGDGIVITPVLQSVARAPSEQVATTGATPPAGQRSNAVIAATAPPESTLASLDRAAIPTRPGLPEPSIIVGETALMLNASERGPLGVPAEQREAMRRNNPALFSRMLASGAFDPEAGQIAAAIQTDLARMSCYAGQVDGVWGTGSVSSVNRYFAVAGGAPVTTDAALPLFRQIAAQPDIACAVVAAAPAREPQARTPARGQSARQPARSQPTRGQSAPSVARSRPAAPRAPAPQAPQAPATRSISPGFTGSGIFR